MAQRGYDSRDLRAKLFKIHSLAAQAQARGVSLDTYVRNLIEAQAAAVDPREPPMTLERFDAELDALAADSETLPSLPAEALTRESFSQDHD